VIEVDHQLAAECRRKAGGDDAGSGCGVEVRAQAGALIGQAEISDRHDLDPVSGRIDKDRRESADLADAFGPTAAVPRTARTAAHVGRAKRQCAGQIGAGQPARKQTWRSVQRRGFVVHGSLPVSGRARRGAASGQVPRA